MAGYCLAKSYAKPISWDDDCSRLCDVMKNRHAAHAQDL